MELAYVQYSSKVWNTYSLEYRWGRSELPVNPVEMWGKWRKSNANMIKLTFN